MKLASYVRYALWDPCLAVTIARSNTTSTVVAKEQPPALEVGNTGMLDTYDVTNRRSMQNRSCED